MGVLSDHVNLVITADSVGVARAGFGVPLILSHNAAWPERIRFYTSYAAVVADGFAATSPEALAAAAMFAQSPRPARIAIGRAALVPTLQYTVSVATVRNSYTYEIDVKGEGVTATTADYDSDSAATAAEIHNGVLTALNAVTGKNYTAAFAPLVVPDVTFTADATDDELDIVGHGLQTGDGPVRLTTTGTLPAGLATATDYYVIRVTADAISLATSLANALSGTKIDITDTGTGTHTLVDTASTVRPSDPFLVTGTSAGDWFSLEVASVSDISIAMTHSDPGVATDLAAIALIDNSWYGLYTLYNSEAYVLAAAAWVESNKKLYIADSNASEDITSSSTGSAGVLDELKDAGYTRTAGAYHPSPADMMGAAWLGNCLPREPGSETWKFKRLAGVSPVVLTATQRTNLIARNANSYETVAGVNITFEGTTAAGPSDTRGFIDVVRSLDWLEDDMAKGVFGALAGASKIPRTDPGMVTIESEVRASLQRAITRTIAAEDPAPAVEVPLIADMDDLLPRGVRIAFSFTLAGAIHSAQITGVVVL